MNPYYNYTDGVPIAGSRGTSFSVRNEFALVGAGFDAISVKFPNFGTVINASSAEVNYLVGVTSSIQTQINAKGAIAGQAWTGIHDFTLAALTAPTPTLGDSSTKVATTAFVASTALAASLPGQTGNAGRVMHTNGTVAYWDYHLPPVTHLTALVTAVIESTNVCTNAGQVTATLPATAVQGSIEGARISFLFTNGRADNILARNTNTIMGLAEDLVVDATQPIVITLQFLNSSWRLA